MSAGSSSGTHYDHVGLRVADLDRTVEFYRSVFGFETAESYPVDGGGRSQYIQAPGIRIELVWLEPAPEPGHSGAGFDHLSFYVDDVDTLIERIAGHGGTLVPDTRQSIAQPDGSTVEIAYCTDPDGTRLELLGHTPAP